MDDVRMRVHVRIARTPMHGAWALHCPEYVVRVHTQQHTRQPA